MTEWLSLFKAPQNGLCSRCTRVIFSRNYCDFWLEQGLRLLRGIWNHSDSICWAWEPWRRLGLLLRMPLKAEKGGKTHPGCTLISSHTWSLPRSSCGLSPAGNHRGLGNSLQEAAPGCREQEKGEEWTLGQPGLGLAFLSSRSICFLGPLLWITVLPLYLLSKGLHSHGFNQPWIEYIQEKKKIPESTKK